MTIRILESGEHMQQKDFNEMKEHLKRILKENCRVGNHEFALRLTIALITSRAGWQSERRYTESQLMELFALADVYK